MFSQTGFGLQSTIATIPGLLYYMTVICNDLIKMFIKFILKKKHAELLTFHVVRFNCWIELEK